MGKVKRLKFNLFDIRRRPKDKQVQQGRTLRGIRRSTKPGPARAKMLKRR